MANTFIDPISFSVERANSFINQLSTSQRYLFASDHRPTSNTTLAPLSQASSNTFYTPWQQMIFGVAVKNWALGIPNYPYKFGTTYQMWDDQVDMSTQMWYAIVNAGSYSHVFGCLENSNGTPSSVQPDFATAVSADDFTYRTSDGYKWVYLSTTDSGTIANLATSQFFPLIPNTSVAAAATPGSIDEILVVSGGNGYDNYSDGTFQASDIKYSAVPTLYQLSNSSISSANGYYQGCILTITSGTGVGQFATINQYFVNSQGHFANISAPFSITPTNGSRWEIMPGVQVVSDQTQTVNVVARALVNSTSANSVWRVEVLENGKGYYGQISNTYVVANSVVGVVTAANVRSIYSPARGHGGDVATELCATQVLMGCTFSNTEGGLIPATNTYKQVGILNNPQFANVQITLSSPTSIFDMGETVDFMSLTWAASNASTNSSSVVVSCDTRMMSPNLQIFVQTVGSQFLATVATVTNSTSMNLTSNSSFTTNAVANVYVASIQTRGTAVNPVSSSNVFVSGVTANLTTGLTMYGEVSGSSGTVNAISRNGVSKNEGTFIQLTKLAISVLGGSFVQNEIVLQGNSTALVHSQSNGQIYLSNLSSPFVAGNNIVGNTSGATASVSVVYHPELVSGSGTMEYLENVEVLTRSPTTGESFIICYKF